MSRVFKDRNEAGKLLAEKVVEAGFEKPVVFGLPRGGVPVAGKIAQALNVPLDTVISRKLGAPDDPEFGFGAIAPGDVVVFNDAVVDSLALTDKQINNILTEERIELGRRMAHYKSGQFIKDTTYDTAIVVDDGLATGITAVAAVKSIALIQKPKHIVFAAPVCSEEALRVLGKLVDDIVCLHTPEYFLAVGQWYERFNQVSDDEVLYILHSLNDVRLGRRPP